MSKLYSLLTQLIPDLEAMYQERYAILKTLSQHSHPLGRQMIAQEVHLSERTVRTLIESMRDLELVYVSRQGVLLSSLGRDLLDALDAHHELSHASVTSHEELAELLQTHLGVAHCHVVSGSVDMDTEVYLRLAQATERVLADELPDGQVVISVTGGGTLASVANGFSDLLAQQREITFVPSRGGMGGDVMIQSNAVASLLAQRTGGEYKPLYIPEVVSEASASMYLSDAAVRERVKLAQSANCLLLSVGTAKVMAERRRLDDAQIETIDTQQAVGEAFGVFYDARGETVVRYPRVGLAIEDLSSIPLIVTIAVGSEKAQAIEGFYQMAPTNGYLICDEAVAYSILNGATR